MNLCEPFDKASNDPGHNLTKHGRGQLDRNTHQRQRDFKCH